MKEFSLASRVHPIALPETVEWQGKEYPICTDFRAVLLAINWKLALITCAPIPLIFLSGIIFSKKVRPFFRISQKKMGELNGKLQAICGAATNPASHLP